LEFNQGGVEVIHTGVYLCLRLRCSCETALRTQNMQICLSLRCKQVDKSAVDHLIVLQRLYRLSEVIFKTNSWYIHDLWLISGVIATADVISRLL